mgnify:CR=1 FL=1
MTPDEIREVIDLVKKSHPYATKYKGVKEDEALQLLVDFATQVVDRLAGLEEVCKKTIGDYCGYANGKSPIYNMSYGEELHIVVAESIHKYLLGGGNEKMEKETL